MRGKNTNSPTAATVVLLLGVLAAWWQGWPGLVLYLAGFLAGRLGVVVNARRATR